VSKFENDGWAVVYLDDIAFVGPQGGAAGSIWGEPPLGQATGQTSAVAAAPAIPAVPTPVKEEATKDLVVKEEAAGLKVSFSSRLQFQSGQAVLEPTAVACWISSSVSLNAYPINRVLIEGHTDQHRG